MELPFFFISENGGGIFFQEEWFDKVPPGTIFAENMWKYSIGTSYDLLVKSLLEIRDESGWHLQGFSEMTLEEISHLTGLDMESSRLAAMREFDEPFTLLDEEHIDLEALYAAADKRGLKITKGGRFYHLHGKYDKGAAVKKIISWYKQSCPRIFTIALGDSPNDFSMLKQVDRPVLVRSQQNFPGIKEEIPGITITREIGPEGWNTAVVGILSNKIKGGIS
jgi:mannosyl-3-phosphoglycerate phosphatase